MIFQILFDASPSVQPVAASTGSLGLWPAILILGLIAIIILGVLFQKILKSLRRPELHGLTPEKVRETWAEIQKNAGHGTMGAKMAVIEADKLLDGVMRSMLIPGDTMGERLKTAEYSYPNIRKVWPAHKLRNQLVHDTTFELSSSQARQALAGFEAALKTLNIL